MTARWPPVAVGQALEVELAIDRDDGQDEPPSTAATSVLKTRPGSMPRAVAASIP